MDEPLPIEIIDHTSWLQLWLPSITAMLVSVIALIGVLVSNATNRRAIDAADERSRSELAESRERDLRLWQRDTLLRIADDVVSAAIDAHAEYEKVIANGYHVTRTQLQASFEVVDSHGRNIGANIARLRLIGVYQIADRCVALRNMINNPALVKSIVDLLDAAHTFVDKELHGERQQAIDQAAASDEQRKQLLAQINDARAAFGDAVESELTRTNTPTTSSAAPTGRRHWYRSWLA